MVCLTDERMNGMFSSLSSLARWAILSLFLLILVLASFYLYGRHKYSEGRNDSIASQAKMVYDTSLKSVLVTNQVITQYTPRVQYIHGAVTTILKKVPIYVTKENDSNCVIPNSFTFLWNATNKMQFPDDTRTVPGGTSDVVLSDIAAQHTREAGIAHENEERIRAMKSWLIEQQRVYNSR